MSQAISATAVTTWQEELIQAVRDPRELLNLLELPLELLPQAEAASELFELKVPRPFVARMAKGKLNDPLLRQVLPLAQEHKISVGFSQDPLAEAQSNSVKGLVHKYQGRVLLVVAPNCAVNCRYCFRRHFPYQDNNPSRQQWLEVFDQIARDSSIHEVIFSGGDPLASPDRQLQWMVDQLEQIPHLKRLRIHTRLPVVIPQRVTDTLLHWLTGSRLKPVMVIHANHASELDGSVAQALSLLRQNGVMLLNQAVLLKGVNDQLDDQVALSERLFELDVLPYYLHLLDKVQGTAHFDLPHQQAVDLHRQMQAVLPGFLVPKLVREEAGERQKTLIL
ncbi:MAG: EF-P beta-lysylation protein EpmB [Cellvibrionaceae bacterium]